jgi:hypothetical protein
MPKSKRALRAVLPALTHGEERSTLFWWMLDHLDELVSAANGRRPRWGQLCERFASLDLKDGHGRPPSPEAARRTWRHVRLFAASQEAAKLPKRSKPPSRMSPEWRPQEVVQTPPPSSNLSRQVAVVGGAPAAEPEFATVDPAGTPLAPGYVFYNGKVMLRYVAEQVARALRQAREWDRGK